jgi:hypothetical protein
MTNRLPSRLLLVALLCSCTGEIESAEGIDGPACAEDPTPASPRLEGMAWDLARDFDSDAPVCSADDPSCDRLDEPDADDEPPTLAALTDPLTSTDAYRTWPGGRIPYRFARDANGDPYVNSATRTALSQAMTNWEQLSEGRIDFVPKTSTDTAYVVIKQGAPRVRPFVGYRKGQVQELYLRDSEYITVIKHELGHVIGLHHEQRRTDRSSYIQVRSGNIVDSDTCRYQFATCSTCKKVGSYNRGSVMHYRTTDLGNCRTGPVLLKLDGTSISHYWKVTTKDLDAVATMYDAATPPPPPVDDDLPATGSVTSSEVCIAVTDASMEAGAAVQARTCDGMPDQDWRITSDGQLRVQHSLQCAAVVGCSGAGATLEQATCSPTAPDQKWQFADMQIVNGVGGATTSKCADVTDATGGSVVAFSPCTDSPTQRFQYRAETETIETMGLCVTSTATAAAGDNLTLAPCDGSDAQRWFQGRGGFVTRVNTARCMRVEGGPATGTKLELGDCTDAVDQRWALRGPIRDARAGLCLTGATTEEPIELTACDGGASQIWTFWSR